MNRKNKQCGFTLIETMVSLAIFTILLSAVYAVMFAGEKSWQASNTKIQLQEGLRNASDTFIDELRQASYLQVAIASGGKSITFSVPVQSGGEPDQEDITLPVKEPYAGETVQFNYPKQSQWGAYKRLEEGQDNRVQYLFSGADNTLARQIITGGGAVMEEYIVARDVEDVTFSQPDIANPGHVNMDISARKTTAKDFPVIYRIITSVYCESKSI